ncbi:hypothetical protein BD414DRAFT_526503 [Trametes punicea]|nr:hypothetical protein BD414DRAFT_526503 [Trametes punicea]
MAADSPEKPSRKHKKAKYDAAHTSETARDDGEEPRKSKKAKADQPAAGDVVGHTSDAEPAPLPDAAKSKKEKKNKESEPAEKDADSSPRDAEESKKRKKKRKQVESAALPEATPASAPSKAVAEPSEERGAKSKTSKHKEKNKGKEEDEEATERGGAAARSGGEADNGSDVGTAARSAGQPAKEDKTKKKRKRKQGVADKSDAQEHKQADGEESRKPKKRKRRTTSGFPDPTEDESLSEQAQKALHYAFTQFEEPHEWKFNKARQNWIIRNCWSEQAIPETYMALVSRYLQGVQGGAREALVKLCQEVVDAVQPPDNSVSAQESNALRDAESEKQTDPPTRRTVNFSTPAAKSSDDSDSAGNETRRRRASMILAALTSEPS